VALSREHDYLHQTLLSMVFLATAIEAIFLQELRSERLSRMIARAMAIAPFCGPISILILLGSSRSPISRHGDGSRAYTPEYDRNADQVEYSSIA